MPLTEQAIDTIASAIFEVPGAQVFEAYSDFDKEPRRFASADELGRYVKDRISTPDGMAHVFVVYPDMAGRAVRKMIQLDPAKVPEHTIRYTWEGWGLISVQLGAENGLQSASCVTANSEKRAIKWASTYSDLPPPNTWNWKCVKSHMRRLQRVLQKVA
jgi:hypothetical protein